MSWVRRPLGALAALGLRAASRRRARMPRGPLRVRGLDGAVAIGFDDDGVPHIRAGSDCDAFFALGFCHAHDRFFQMDMLRRVLSGRLSEVLGERSLGELGSTVAADHLLRVLDLRGSALRTVADGTDEEEHLLGAYVNGVNQCLSRVLRRRRPIEHRLLGIPLERWTYTDSVLIAKGMALGLSFKWRTAPVFAAIADRLRDDPEKLAAVLPPGTPRALHDTLAHLGASFEGLLDLLPPATPARGSNAFVVGGGRTQSGKPILASDPHLELGLPSVWYLASVRGTQYQAVGATLPGLPGVVIGRTPRLTWGLTNGMIDDADVWEEELDDAGARYRVDGRWEPLQVETQEIGRRGKAPHLVRVRRTHRGPLLTDAFVGYEGPPLSLRMTLHDAAPDMQAFLALGRARDVASGLQALDAFGAPAQNVVLADADGGTAFRLMGKVPVRTFDRHPALPRDGTTRASDWTGMLEAARLPRQVLRPRDVLVTANDPHPQSEDVYLTHLYEPVYRAARLRALLGDAEGLTADDAAAAQCDVVDLGMQRFRRAVIEPLADAARRDKPAHGPLLDRLLSWDGDSAPQAQGAVVAHLTYHHLLRRTFGPTLGEGLTLRWMGLVNFMDRALHLAFAGDDSPWAPAAVRPTLLVQALDDVAQALRARGLTLDSPWGAFHTLTLAHPAGRAKLLRAAFSRGPFPAAGAPFTPNSGQYAHPHPGPMTVGASYRHVVDFGALDDSRMILAGGQSGHLGSAHYDDQIARWQAGQGIPMRLEHPPTKARWTHLAAN